MNRDTNLDKVKSFDNQWDIDFNVPLMLEAKIGNNWLDTKDVM